MWISNLPTPTPLTSNESPVVYFSEVAEKWGKRGHYTVLFLTSVVKNSERAKILAQLADPEPADTWPERPKFVYARPLKAAKWLRNWTPGSKKRESVESCIAQMIRASLSVSSLSSVAYQVRFVSGDEVFEKRKGRGMLFVDEETIKGLKSKEGATVIVVTFVYCQKDDSKDPEQGDFDPDHIQLRIWAARVPIRRANLLLSLAYDNAMPKSLDDAVPNAEKLEICEPANELIAGRFIDKDRDYELPSHLPADLKLSKDKVDIVSLVHLNDEQMKVVEERIKKTSQDLGNDDDNDEDGTTDDTTNNAGDDSEKTEKKTEQEEGNRSKVRIDYNLSINIHNWPAKAEPCTRNELYDIFQKIRPTSQTDPGSTYVPFVDISDPSAEPSDEPELILVEQSHVPATSSVKFENDHGLEMYEWPDNESLTEQWSLICDPSIIEDYKKDTGKSPWFDGFKTDAFEVITDPVQPVPFGRAYKCYVLIDLSETELRKVKAKVRLENVTDFGCFEFVQVGKHLNSPDMKGLMQWFEKGFTNNEQPPHYFVALDQQSIDYYRNDEGDKHEAMILASTEPIQNDHNGAGVHDYLGFGYGRLSTEDAVCGCCQLEVANASFYEETVAAEKISYIYWSDILESERRTPGEDGFMMSDDDYKESKLDFMAVPQGKRAPEDQIE